jgi:hypothetical protein
MELGDGAGVQPTRRKSILCLIGRCRFLNSWHISEFLAHHLKLKKVWRAFLESFQVRLRKKFCVGYHDPNLKQEPITARRLSR